MSPIKQIQPNFPANLHLNGEIKSPVKNPLSFLLMTIHLHTLFLNVLEFLVLEVTSDRTYRR